MSYSPKPHVSNALAHLRFGVTACVLVITIAAALQMLVFGFAHFTQVRFQGARQPNGPASLSVVTAPRQVSGIRANSPPGGAPGPSAQPVGPAAVPAAPSPADFQGSLLEVTRQVSTTDAALHVLSDIAGTTGTLATVTLAIFILLGVCVAGGAAVPGVDRVVSSAGFALMLGLACIPWRDVFQSLPFPGVFSGYETMIELSDAVNAGGQALPLFTMYLVMPAAAMICAFLVLARFRAGVAEGVIVTSVSELDERLEREMAGIRAKGVGAHAPRAVAALNHAIGDTPEQPEPTPEPEPAAEAAPRRIPGVPLRPPSTASRSIFPGGRERRIGETDPGDPLKRPI